MVEDGEFFKEMLLFEEKIELTLDQCFKQSLTFTWILGNDLSNFWKKSGETWSWFQFEMWSANTLLQVNLFQKHLFLHQLTHNMTKDCSLIYQFLHENYKLRTYILYCVHKLFWMSKQKQKNNLCTQLVLSL